MLKPSHLCWTVLAAALLATAQTASTPVTFHKDLHLESEPILLEPEKAQITVFPNSISGTKSNSE